MNIKMDKKENNKYNVSFEDSLIDQNGVVSSTECTGLVQTPPSTNEESKSYTNLYNIPKPQDHKREQDKKV